MAYTGTGTEQDPYIVTTFADFLTCISDAGSGAGAYVKIANDLDAAAEGYEYIDTIAVKAAKIYADTKTKIKNVTVAAQYMLKYDGQGVTSHGVIFKNLHFQNWTQKNITSGGTQVFNVTATNNLHAIFEDCEFNFAIQAENSSVTFTSLDEFYHCSVYLEIYNATGFSIAGNTSYGWDILKNSNFYFKFHNAKIASNTNVLVGSSYCGFIVDGLSINYTSLNNVGSYGAGFSYIVFKDCTVATSCAVSGSQSSMLICLDNTTGITSANLPILTPEQLKSEEYLQQIGWLP